MPALLIFFFWVQQVLALPAADYRQVYAEDHGFFQPNAKSSFSIISTLSPVEHLQTPSLQQRISADSSLQISNRFGLPTILRLTSQSNPSTSAITAKSASLIARKVLVEQRMLYGWSSDEVNGFIIEDIHLPKKGPIVVRFSWQMHGIPVFGERINVLFDPQLRPVALTGYLNRRHQYAPQHQRTVEELLPVILDKIFLETPDCLPTGRHNESFSYFDCQTENVSFRQSIRVQKQYFSLPEELVPSFYIEFVGEEEHTNFAFAGVFSDQDGAMLYRRNLQQDEEHSYLVWADENTGWFDDGPAGSPVSPHPTATQTPVDLDIIAQSIVTVDGNNQYQDPWLPNNASATIGNNVDAYIDFSGQDGFDAQDFRAVVSGNRVHHEFFSDESPQASQQQAMASITHAFYVTNYLHDLFYDYGFDEQAGNAQHSNYGRGGAEQDRMHVEVQDFSGMNNANMMTPSDGSSPVMQLYLFSNQESAALFIDEPASLAGEMTASTASFGSQEPITGQLQLVADNQSPNTDACQVLQQNLQGKIAVIERGGCDFVLKVRHAQERGAIGVLMLNNDTSQPDAVMQMGGDDPGIQIPSLMISYHDGQSILNRVTSETIEVSFHMGILLDAAMDSQIISHEWGHYLFGRLTGGSGSNQSSSINEGLADFLSLLMSVREDDQSQIGNDQFQGAYPVGYFSTQDSYFGIRRAPYSTDMDIFPFTFRHIANNQPLPMNVALDPGSSENSQVHNSGEIFANAMWECYAVLLNTHGFTEARSRMIAYLVAGLKLFPSDATFTEARDAFLLAVGAADTSDYSLLWAAFAKRGLGVYAVAPDRFSMDHQGLEESFSVDGRAAMLSFDLTDDLYRCDDDGFLDLDEQGSLNVLLTNLGGTDLYDVTIRFTVSSLQENEGTEEFFFPAGREVYVESLAPLEKQAISIPIELQEEPSVGVIVAEVEVVGGDSSAQLRTYINVDEEADASDVESFEHQTGVWESTTEPNDVNGWEVQDESLNNRLMYGPDQGTKADIFLRSPPLQVAESGSLGLEFLHRYAFETDFERQVYYDGGVIEVSVNDGQTWQDISTFAVVPYDGIITTLSQNHQVPVEQDNPLSGRSAFAGQSPNFPQFNGVYIDLGESFQGQEIYIRFRIGTDPAVGDFGWEIDDVRVEGLVEDVFWAFVDEDAICFVPMADAGEDQVYSEQTDVTLNGEQSWDPMDSELRFEWQQIQGYEVTLDDKTLAIPSFVTPAVDEAETLVFSLHVTNEQGITSNPDEVTITVENIVSSDTSSNNPRNPQAEVDITIGKGASCGCSSRNLHSKHLVFWWLLSAILWLRRR